MDIKQNQLQLIEMVQQLIGYAIEQQQFDLAANMGFLLNSLTKSYSDLQLSVSSTPSQSVPFSFAKPQPQPQSTFKTTPTPPSQYVWQDGFKGVTVKQQPEDYWEKE